MIIQKQTAGKTFEKALSQLVENLDIDAMQEIDQ